MGDLHLLFFASFLAHSAWGQERQRSSAPFDSRCIFNCGRGCGDISFLELDLNPTFAGGVFHIPITVGISDDGVAASAQSFTSARVHHCGLRPSEMLTSDGAILADSPALPPIRLADFSTWPRRALSSRHRSDSELRSLFHREAAAVVALPLAGLRLP